MPDLGKGRTRSKINAQTRIHSTPYYYGSLKTSQFDNFELGNMSFFKPMLDFGLEIWFFNDYESGNKNKNKPLDQSMAQRHGQHCFLPE